MRLPGVARVSFHAPAAFTGARSLRVGIHDEVALTAGVAGRAAGSFRRHRHEAPLHAGGEAGTAPSAKSPGGHCPLHLEGRQGHRLAQPRRCRPFLGGGARGRCDRETKISRERFEHLLPSPFASARIPRVSVRPFGREGVVAVSVDHHGSTRIAGAEAAGGQPKGCPARPAELNRQLLLQVRRDLFLTGGPPLTLSQTRITCFPTGFAKMSS